MEHSLGLVSVTWVAMLALRAAIHSLELLREHIARTARHRAKWWSVPLAGVGDEGLRIVRSSRLWHVHESLIIDRLQVRPLRDLAAGAIRAVWATLTIVSAGGELLAKLIGQNGKHFCQFLAGLQLVLCVRHVGHGVLLHRSRWCYAERARLLKHSIL